MAIINQIGGISTGSLTGVLKGPLEKLFGGKNANVFQYPANLGNDPSTMHVVQFSISEIVPKKFDVVKAWDAVSAGANKAAAEGKAAYQAGVNNGIDAAKQAVISSGTKAATATVSAASAAKDLTAYLKPETKKISTTISLYMPDTLSMNYHAEYSELSLIDATKGFNRIAGAVGSIASDVMEGGMNTESIKNALIRGVNDYGPEAALRAVDMAAGTQLTDLGLKAMGIAVNPQLQLIYKGVGFRTFSLEFVFTPKSKEESDQVSAIINTFIYASSPRVTGAAGMYFAPPSIFNLQFYMAQSGSFSGLANMLQSAGNGIIPGVPLGTFAGNKLGVNAKVENDRLFKVGDCVLEDVSVDYAPNGWAAYSGGAPVQTRLTLSFKEIDILDRTRMEQSSQLGKGAR